MKKNCTRNVYMYIFKYPQPRITDNCDIQTVESSSNPCHQNHSKVDNTHTHIAYGRSLHD